MKKVSLVISCLLVAGCGGVDPGVVELNNNGIKSYQNEDYYGSYQNFVKSLAKEPFHSLIHLNLALSYLKNEEKDKAKGSFQTALKVAESRGIPEELYLSLFDLAAFQSTNGEIDKALANYQRALAMSPADPKIRENIEKIWQQQQSGEGGKGKDDQEKKSDKDQDGDGQQGKQPQEPKQDEGQQKQKKKPKPFKSKELSKNDVRKILQEIQSQEQKIRAEIYEGKAKDSPRAKDW